MNGLICATFSADAPCNSTMRTKAARIGLADMKRTRRWRDGPSFVSPDSALVAADLTFVAFLSFAAVVDEIADVWVGCSELPPSVCVCPHPESFITFSASFSVHSVQALPFCAYAGSATRIKIKHTKDNLFIANISSCDF